MAKSSDGAASRAEAALIVHAVLEYGRSLDQALADSSLTEFEQRDQALIRALAFGALRTHLRNQFFIDALLEKPPRKKDRIINSLLSVGFFDLLESERPDYAVVSSTVGATEELGRKHTRGLVNAILRRFLREQDELIKKASASPAASSQHPEWLVKQLKQDWPAEWQNIVDAGNTQAPMWVRVNESLITPAEWLVQAEATGIKAQAPVKEMPGCVLLDEPKSILDLPGFAAGHCSVQDAASQFVAHYLQPEAGMRVLDACAAPGGKSCHLLEKYPGIELSAVDNSAERLERVEQNLERLNIQAQVICGDAANPEDWWDGEQYDRILLDAPCSATGVIRRHPDIRFLRRESDITQFADTQAVLLEALWRLLKSGGEVLYTTCSVLKAENEDIIEGFLARHPEAEQKPLPFAAPFTAVTAIGQQVLPGSFANDGFYYALLKRA
ncbi:MAG: 16S rRNA (cytosine(967)-C(5))-methyltransferase RsmB [Gammaproteobacteria bacterium]